MAIRNSSLNIIRKKVFRSSKIFVKIISFELSSDGLPVLHFFSHFH